MGYIRGRVIDANTSNGIGFASVSDNYGFFTSATVYGEFESYVAAPSGYVLSASAGGYQPTSHEVTASEYAAQWTVLRLSPAPVTTGCCFSGETPVLMANGRAKRIEAIAIGDLVEGVSRYNKVVGVETPLAGGRPLWRINGGSPFVTAEHPLMTAGGWKSISPEATLAESRTLAVGRLWRGDELVVHSPGRWHTLGAAAVAVGLQQSTVALASLHEVPVDPMTKVYNLMLDGDHTYFASGYLVHNKW